MAQGKKHIIYLHGHLGAGKSSTAKRLAEYLHYERLSGGHFARQTALERGISFADMQDQIQADPNFDIVVDENQKKYMHEHDNLVVDGRLGFYLMGDQIFNVFLTLDEETAAQRILRDMQSNPDRMTERVQTLEEVVSNNRHRLESEAMRYKALYNIASMDDPAHYNLVIDTAKHTPEEVVSSILNKYQQWLELK